MNGHATTIEELNRARRRPAPPPGASAAGRGGRGGDEYRTPLPHLSLWAFAATKDVVDWLMDFLLIGEIPFLGQIPGMILTVLFIMYLRRRGDLSGGGTRKIIAYLLLGVDNAAVVNNLPLTSVAASLLRSPRR